MSEADFQRQIAERLTWRGRRVLRVSDGTDARRGVFGLRAITIPTIDSAGADLLVLPNGGVPCVLARSSAEVEAVIAEHLGPLFIELKDPKARRRTDQREQEEWMAYVRGERR